jgi:hypothetical protein
MPAGKGQALLRRQRAFAALRRGDSRREASQSAEGETQSGSPQESAQQRAEPESVCPFDLLRQMSMPMCNCWANGCWQDKLALSGD